MNGERRKNEGEGRREENMIRRTKKYLGTPKKKVGLTSCNVCPSEPCVEIIRATVNL